MEESIKKQRSESERKQHEDFPYRGKTVRTQACKYPCSVCGNGLGRNSMYVKLMHKRCSGIWVSITKATNFRCQNLLDKNLEERITLDKDDIETVDRFSYLGDVLSTEGGAQKAVTSRIRSAWKKCKYVSNILCKKNMPLKITGILFKSYVWSTLSYGTECKVIKGEDEKTLEHNRKENVVYVTRQSIKGESTQ